MSGGFTPRLRRSSDNVHAEASFLASEDYTVKRGGITLDADLVQADENGDKILKAGTFVTPVAATGKYGPYGGTTNEVQTATVTGDPTGGTFTLTFGGETTAALDFDASAQEVEDALVALPNVDEGDVEVTKASNVYTITFGGEYGTENVPALTADGSGLTGGTTPGVTIATPTAGGAAISDLATPDPDVSGYLPESVNLRDGDVICGLYIRCSVLKARVTPTPDSTIKAAVKGRIIFQ